MKNDLQFLILRLAALLVPPPERPEWLRDWQSELWYVQRDGGKPFAFCFGAFKDGFWVKRNSPRAGGRSILSIQSPARCVLLLAFIAVLGTCLGFSLPGSREAIQSEALPLLVFLMPCIALLILPATTSLSLGEYPVAGHSRTMRLRRWIFLGAKFAFVWVIVFFGILDLSHILSVRALQPHGSLVGYVLAFRWVLKDQRRRCPVCLRLVTNPTRIGQPAQTLLDWYGTELMCERGHGLLYVPAIAASYTVQRWLDLDPSWRSLFP